MREAEIGDVAEANAQLFELIGERHWYMRCPTEPEGVTFRPRELITDTRRPRGCIASRAGSGSKRRPVGR